MNSIHSRKIATCFALVAMTSAALVGCSGGEKTEPTTTTTTSPSPTEKGLDPTGGNKFSPTVKAPPPQTAAPGNLPGNHPG